MAKKTTSVVERITPSSNTGLNGERSRIAARIHWLQGTIRQCSQPDLERLRNYLAAIFRDEWTVNEDQGETHGIRYESSARSGAGMRMCWTMDPETGWCRAWWSLTGSVLDRVPLEDVGRVARALLLEWGAGITRYDAAIDDYARRCSPMDAIAAAMRGDLHGAQKWELIASGVRGHYAATGYFGSRSSDKLVRCYDKWEESDGEIDAIRWEVQYKDELADAALRDVVSRHRDDGGQFLAALIARQVAGAIDFRDAQSGRRADERTRLAWWQSIVDDCAGTIRITVSRITSALEEKLVWLHKQVAPTLAQLFEAAPHVFSRIVHQLRRQGRERLTPAQNAQVGAYHRAVANPSLALDMLSLSLCQVS